MASPYKEIPITFEKGLVTEIEESLLDIGQASELQNWDPLPNGALRARNQWAGVSKTGLPTSTGYEVRGWGTVAIGGTGGTATPAVVQEVHIVGSLGSTETVVLNGVTIGNILIAYLAEDSAGGVAAGWTEVYAPSTVTQWFMKVAASTTESFDVTGATNIEAIEVYELSNVASGVPTGTFYAPSTGAQINFTATSPSGIGIALIHASAGASGLASPSPTADGFTEVYTNQPGVLFRHHAYRKTFGASPVTASFDVGASADNRGTMVLFDAATSAANPADFFIIIAVTTTTGYSIYRIPRDEISTGTWELVDSAVCADTSAFVSMAVGAGVLVWSASTMDEPRAVILDTLVASDVTDLTGEAGRSVVYHKDRMFVAGAAGTSGRVFFSDIGDPDSYNTVTDYLDIGGDDGEAIEDMISVEGLLLICKTNRLYLVSGSGIESFFVNELPGGSAATGRSAIRTPYGTIVAGPADIWVVQGGSVDPMSRPLGADYAITSLVSTAYAQDSVLVADSATGVTWTVNLVTGAWKKESVQADENAIGHLFSLQGRLYYGVYDSDSEVGGTRRLSSARSYDFVGGTDFIGATGRVALLGPSVKYTPRWLFVQTRIHDTAYPNVLFVEIESDHGTTTKDVQVESTTQRDRIDLPGLHQGSEWIKLTFHASSSAIAGAIDVERVVLGVDVEAPR